MNDAEYAKSRWLTLPRLFAGLWVVLWVSIVHQAVGFPWAVQAVIFFQLPLSFIWFPDLLSRIAGVAQRRYPLPDVVTTSHVVSWIGWLVLVGAPMTWSLWWQN